MKNKLKIVACSLFLSVGTLTALVVMEKENNNPFNLSTVKADAQYSLTLDANNKYLGGGSQYVSTDRDVGALVNFAYSNATESTNGHVVLGNGGTLKNIDQLTSLASFEPTFVLNSGASLSFRLSNDGTNWGEYASIKSKDDSVSLDSFAVPYMRYIEFKAEGGSVDITSIVFSYSCSESDNTGLTNYEIGTDYVDSNLSYTTNDSFNSLSSNIAINKKFNGGASEALDSSFYNISVKNPSNVEIDKNANLVAGTHTVTISRKDRAFADTSFNFTVVADRFNVTTDLTTPKEIHTAAQKTYLSYDGDYATMNPNDYPNGDQLLSDPLPVDLAWTFTPTSGKTLSKYTVTFGQNADLSDGREIEGTSSSSIQLYNAYLGTNYFKINAKYSDNTVESSTIKSFVVDGTAPRNLAIGGMTNCRDMGGRTTISGAKIKQGLLYRTSGYKYDYSTEITEAGKNVMKNIMRVKTEINVADGTKYNVGSYVNATTYNAFMDYGGNNPTSKHHFGRNAESVKNVFKLLADENNYPIFYHCRIGTDRTGLVGNLVYGLLGVPLNMIYQDYLFSNFGKIGEKRYIGSQAGQDDISIYMQEINAMQGANFQEKVYNTLLSIGVSRSTLDSVINFLTDGTKPNNDKGQITLDVNDMTLSGTTATYTARSNVTDRNEPLYYAQLSSNASASYTFTTTETGNATIYGYLGHNDYSTSKYINTSVKVTIDNADVTIPTKTFAEAGMGNVSNRTNYYFVPLGTVTNLAAGEHTIKITGLANNMKLGTLSVFGVPGTANAAQGGQGGDTPHTHNIVAGNKVGSSNLRVLECECGELTDYGYELSTSDMVSGQNPAENRLGKGTNKSDVWDITGIEAGIYSVYMNAKTQSGNENAYWNAGDDVTHNNNSSQNGGAKAGDIAYRYKIAVDSGEQINVGLSDTKYSDTGLGSTAAAWTSASLAEITVGANATRITLTGMNNGYAIWVYGLRLIKAS